VEDLIKSIGVPAVVVLLILQQVQNMLARRNQPPAIPEPVHKELLALARDMLSIVRESHQWQAVEDPEGVKRMYTPLHMKERLDGLEKKMDSLMRTVPSLSKD
jgi:hypothetical protein